MYPYKSIYTEPREVIVTREPNGHGHVLVSVVNPKPIAPAERDRMYQAAPELLSLLRALAIRFEIEIDEQGDDARFPGRAWLTDMQRAISVADGTYRSYDEQPPRVSPPTSAPAAVSARETARLAPIASYDRARYLAQQAIDLFLEYRDKHGYDETTARSAAIGEIAEGTAADLRYAHL